MEIVLNISSTASSAAHTLTEKVHRRGIDLVGRCVRLSVQRVVFINLKLRIKREIDLANRS